ncbi:unnamed protein product [Linum trigynum]|uniref:Uncharacterized protein n=1 Tax=Linum trigynum TaxID=586398 RepID=A0AAV2EU76_9ROSI
MLEEGSARGSIRPTEQAAIMVIPIPIHLVPDAICWMHTKNEKYIVKISYRRALEMDTQEESQTNYEEDEDE